MQPSLLLTLALSLTLAAGCSPAGASLDSGRPVDDATTQDAASIDAFVIDSPDAVAIDASTIDTASDAPASTTVLRIVYPAGHTITVRGSAAPLSWTIGMRATDVGGGNYEIRLQGLSGTIEFKPLLDDTTWSRGPNYHVDAGDTIEIAPHFTATSGRYETLLTWTSTLLGNSRPVYAYLPAAYDENTSAHFPVLYMHDGQNLFDSRLAFGGNEWMVDETMTTAGESGRCPNAALSCSSDGDCGGARCDTWTDTIVIGVGNTSARIYEYTPTTDPGTPGGGGGDAYLHALITELKPMLDTMLRTRTTRADTAMMGSSLGGLISAHAGVANSDTFGTIGAMSPSTWWSSREIIAEVMGIPSHTSRALRVYVDSGDAGPSNDDVTDTADLAAAYRGVGYVEGTDFHYTVRAGAQHSEVYWALRLPSALTFMLAPRERHVH